VLRSRQSLADLILRKMGTPGDVEASALRAVTVLDVRHAVEFHGGSRQVLLKASSSQRVLFVDPQR